MNYEKLYIGIINEKNKIYKILYFKDNNIYIDAITNTPINITPLSEIPLKIIIKTFNLKNENILTIKRKLFNNTNFIYQNSHTFGAKLCEVGYKSKEKYLKYQDGILPFEYFEKLEYIISLPSYYKTSHKILTRKRN